MAFSSMLERAIANCPVTCARKPPLNDSSFVDIEIFLYGAKSDVSVVSTFVRSNSVVLSLGIQPEPVC